MFKKCFLMTCCAVGALAFADEKVWLDELPLEEMTCGYKRPQKGKSIDGHPLTVNGKVYDRGVGTHSESSIIFRLDGHAISFEAMVGPDDEVYSESDPEVKPTVKFAILADGLRVFESGVMRERNSGRQVKVDLRGVGEVELLVDEAWWGRAHDHADWADAFFMMQDGARPVACPQGETDQLGILTPPVRETPRLNGARVFGVRPGHPILWRIPATGVRPMTLAVEGLPEGVSFDSATGLLTGRVAAPGTYAFTVTATNEKGAVSQVRKLVVGDKIALTPPMGWNSWNVFAHTVTERNIRDTIDVFANSGLAEHGWSYVNIDDFWQNNPFNKDDPTLQGPERHADGSIAVNARFTDMKALADYAHAKGFKIGLYSSPGPYTCGRCTGSWKHEWQDAATYAAWGFDYLKYDWCSYDDVAFGSEHARLMLPYRLMGEALRAQDRDIVFSLCQYGMGNVSTWGETAGGNCWRTTGDIFDNWASLRSILYQQEDLWPYAHPGAWNDPDMLVVGKLGWGNVHDTRLTPNEQYTHVSFWSMLCSPLLIGCDLTKLDDFTRSLLTNDEVIDVNQDELGAQAAQVARGPRAEVWAKPMSDGSIVLALFNTHRSPTRITVDFKTLGLDGHWLVRDLWTQQDLGIFADHYTTDVLGHATRLVRCWPKDDGKLRAGLRDIRENFVYRQFAERRPVDKPGYQAPAGYPCAACPKLGSK